jgi:oligoendopeptidase F
MDKFLEDWCLSDYFYNGICDPQIGEDLNAFKKRCDKYIKLYENKIPLLTEEDFLKFLEDSDELGVEETKISMYFELLISLNSHDQKVQKEIAKYSKIFSEYYSKLLFVDEEYKKIGYSVLLKRSEMKMFENFKNNLISISNNLKYLLKPEEERIYIKLDSASFSNLYEEFTTSFEFKFNNKKINESELFELRQHSSRSIRKKAYEEISKVYGNKSNQIVLSNLYSVVCKQNVADVELRGYSSVMSSRNLSEEVSDRTVDNLISIVQKNYCLYHKFLKKKSQILGLDKMCYYDVLAPISENKLNKKHTFRNGWKLYKNTISKVDPLLEKFSEDMLVGGRMSIFPKPGKISGAFAQYSKYTPQFVLLNWTDSIGDVFTMAHELGHAFHGYLSKEQKNAVYDSPLILAETASIFNETLMFETMLKDMSNVEEKRKLICDRLNDIFLTIFRQIAYTVFEKRCHECFLKNQPLTASDYNKIWVEEIKKLYGKNIEIDQDVVEHGWSSISHIYDTPFYCYTYAFGNIISLNLYQNYKKSKNKNDFIKKYHKLLSSGGSDTPENLLYKIFKIKFDEKFYKTAFDNINDLIKKIK